MTSAGAEIAAAVGDWLDALDPAQRERATFRFEDAERFAWFYTPDPPRNGLALGEMRRDQQALAGAIVAASASTRAAREIAAIVALEPVLGELERAAHDPMWRRRDPTRYWFAAFGDPRSIGPWSWRLGGHHVAIHLTVADGEVVGVAPSFLGANPAVVPSGPVAGTRTLPGEEELARTLLETLAPRERLVAVVDTRAPADILTGNARYADVASVPIGIRHAELGASGRVALERLIRHYVDRVRAELADATWARAVADDLGDVTFAWSGSDEPGQGHYYAIRGRGFVIEYDNTQNGANHIHAVWREPANDWGEDLLARHLRTSHA